MKKLKHGLIALTKISLLCLAFFVLSPSVKVQAMFSDTANINMGIKLELGTVSLATKEITTIGSVNYSGGEPITIASKKLLNDGSLSAKLAYKFVIKKADGTVLSNEELSGVSVLLNFGDKAKEVSASVTALKTNSFTFVKDANNKDIIIDPSETEGIPVAVNYKSNAPIETEKLTVEVTFRLIQSNAADANAEMFSDEETVENTVSLVPKVIEEGSYWPAKNTFVKLRNSDLSYSLEKMDMVFSEVYDPKNSNNKKIENLNKAILYIQVPKETPLRTENRRTKELMDTFKATPVQIDKTGDITIEKTEIDDSNHGIKITFKLNDEYNLSKNQYSIDLNLRIDRFIPSIIFGGVYSNGYTSINYKDESFAKRLVLDSDNLLGMYLSRSIPLTVAEKTINLRQLKAVWYGNVLENFQWNNEKIELEVIGDNNNYVLKNMLTPYSFYLKLIQNNANFNGATLNVKITGDTGHALVISRKLENDTKSRSMSMRSVENPLVEDTQLQPEHQADPEIEVVEPETAEEDIMPNEPIIEAPLEEAVVEESIDDTTEIEETEETEETEEAVNPSTSESNAESNVDTSIPVENLK